MNDNGAKMKSDFMDIFLKHTLNKINLYRVNALICNRQDANKYKMDLFFLKNFDKISHK